MSHSWQGPNLLQITRLGFVNAYLVREDDGLTLVDTMIPGSAGAIAAAVEAADASLKRLTVTHGHADHVGSVDAVVGRFAGVELAYPEREARIMAGDHSLDPDEPGPRLSGFRASAYAKVKARPHRTLAPGDRLGSLEVIPVPGHTPGQVAFRDVRDGTLLCADVYATLLGPVTSAKPTLRSPIPAIGTWNRSLALESARRLRALDPSRLAPGHGKVVTEPAAVMDRALATAS
jgi:glyoxylase-like metal-dependent hydrolase (beta-lactamase superfamily II)